jgi:prepilin-type N-terminal cleavage/methylation domain-containing protein
MERDPRLSPPPAPGGFTLVEVMVSLGVLGILLVSVFSITVETYAFIGNTDIDFTAQNEANQGFSRMTEILRKSGWNTAGATSYPRVLNGGNDLEFRTLKDLDGNGYGFAKATGELEWGPNVYRIRLDGAGNLRVFLGADPVWHLARYVTRVTFTTYLQDPTLQINEIGVTLQARKLTRRGDPIDFSISGSIDMRN